MVNRVAVGRKSVGQGEPCLIIAEAGVNHNGNPKLAADLVRAAADAGADAVKFQLFDPDALASAKAPQAAYQKQNAGDMESQVAMLRGLVLPLDTWADLKALSLSLGLEFLCSPFDTGSATTLFELGIPAFKVGSGELTNHPFLVELAGYGLPMLLSTGMATLDEVQAAVSAICEKGHVPLVLLHCVSAYPADPSDCNLKAMKTMEDAFAVPVGFSDHTDDTVVSVAAAALGAKVIEKHLTLDRSLAGPDHRASLEPSEFRQLCSDIRTAEAALGTGVKNPVHSEMDTTLVARKSIVVKAPLEAGDRLEDKHVCFQRPGTGISPARWAELRGSRMARPASPGEMLENGMLGS